MSAAEHVSKAIIAEQANEFAERANMLTSEWLTSGWPSTYVPILICSEPQWSGERQ